MTKRTNARLFSWSSLRSGAYRLQRERAVKFFEALIEYRAKIEQLVIAYINLLGFDLGEPAARAVPAFELELRCEFILRPSGMVAQLSDHSAG